MCQQFDIITQINLLYTTANKPLMPKTPKIKASAIHIDFGTNLAK